MLLHQVVDIGFLLGCILAVEPESWHKVGGGGLGACESDMCVSVCGREGETGPVRTPGGEKGLPHSHVQRVTYTHVYTLTHTHTLTHALSHSHTLKYLVRNFLRAPSTLASFLHLQARFCAASAVIWPIKYHIASGNDLH